MIRRLLTAAALAVAGFSTVPVQAQTADEQKRLNWTLERGRLIFALDRPKAR